MNWEIAGNVSEFASSIAVVVSLIYVGYELRSNTCTVRTSTAALSQAALATINDLVAGECRRFLDTLEPHREAASKASGLHAPKWSCARWGRYRSGMIPRMCIAAFIAGLMTLRWGTFPMPLISGGSSVTTVVPVHRHPASVNTVMKCLPQSSVSIVMRWQRRTEQGLSYQLLPGGWWR